MTVAFSSDSCDCCNALLIASVQGSDPTCHTAYFLQKRLRVPANSANREPAIHFSWRFGPIIPQAAWARLSLPRVTKVPRPGIKVRETLRVLQQGGKCYCGGILSVSVVRCSSFVGGQPNPNNQSCCSETVLEGHVARCLHGFNELYRDSHYTSVSSNESTGVDLLVWICAQAKGNIIKVGETCIFCLCQPGFPPVPSCRLETCRFHWLKLT